MAKFYGTIGYVENVETTPGVWGEQVTERSYHGDLLRSARKLNSSNEVNDSVNISNQVSIVADPFAGEHFHAMRYISLHGVNWKITDIEVQFPRLILTVGGVYHGNEDAATRDPLRDPRIE